MRVKGYGGLIFRQLAKICDRKCSKSSVNIQKGVCFWIKTD